MKAGKIITWIGLAAMTFGLLNGFINGDFLEDGSKLLSNPWGIMSMIDLYVGFTLFSLWIAFREKNAVSAGVWIVLMMVLGFFTACIYMLIAFYASQGDWLKFFLGSRKESVLKESGR
jgi:drug/metabolite transporter (DMT)-like permease